MGRPPINDSYADRFGTFHSITVKPYRDEWIALARLCYLDPRGEWRWVNRRLQAKTEQEAHDALMERVTQTLGCRTQAETNALTDGAHRGHRHVSTPLRRELKLRASSSR